MASRPVSVAFIAVTKCNHALCIVLVVVAVLSAACSDATPDCWDLSRLDAQQQSWFRAGAAHWPVAYAYDRPRCQHTVELVPLPLTRVAEAIRQPGAPYHIRFSADYLWAACERTEHGPTVIADKQDFPTVAAHELGHVLGLEHSADLADVMHAPPPWCAVVYEPEG